jgi:phage gpG-like protein
MDLTPAMRIVSEMLVAAVNDEFETGGQGKWARVRPDRLPLAESTLRQRRGSTAQILVDTGRMAGGIHGEAGADYAEVASDTEYAVFHVSSAPRSRIPLRNFFDLPEQVYEDAVDAVIEYVAEHT